jgi:hypothetical protein
MSGSRTLLSALMTGLFFIYVQGVSFRIDEVELTPELRRVYNKAVDLWVEMLHKFTEAVDLIGQ